MKILVVTSCTKAKKYHPLNPLTIEDFDNPKRLASRTEELEEYKTPAYEMYKGAQHQALMKGLNKVWKQFDPNTIDLYIISAGYGLLSANDVLVPYEVTFQNMTKKDLLKRSKKLKIHQQVEALVSRYNLVFFLLGKEYVIALDPPFNAPESVTQFFLIGKTYKSLIPEEKNITFIPSGLWEAKKLRIPIIKLKGFLFQKICERVCQEGLSVFEQIERDPDFIINNALRLETDNRQQTFWDNIK